MAVTSRPGRRVETGLLHTPLLRRCPDFARRRIQRCAAVLLLGTLTACAARAPYHEGMAPRRPLDEAQTQRIIGVWRQQLAQYIAREGAGDPAVLTQARALRSNHAVRPAQVTFAALDVDASIPDRDGWDVQGVLIGRYPEAYENAWVFMVGIVARQGYRPVSIQDIRVVAFTSRAGDLVWTVSAPAPQSLERYRGGVPGSTAIRFPSTVDRFEMSGSAAGVSVWETRSGAEWLIGPDAETSHARTEKDIAGRSGRS